MPDTRFAKRPSTRRDPETIFQDLRELNPTKTEGQLRLIAAVLATPGSSLTAQLLAYAFADFAGNRRTLPVTPDTVLQIAARLETFADAILTIAAADELNRTTGGTLQ